MTDGPNLERIFNGVIQTYNLVRDIKARLSRDFRTEPLAFYSKSAKGGQIQFSVGRPRWKAPVDGVVWVEKEGAVFIEAAPHLDESKEKLDWKNRKINFALAPKNAGVMINALHRGIPGEVFHEHNGVNKKIQVSGVTVFNGKNSRFLMITSSPSDRSRPPISVSISITDGDAIGLASLLQASFHYTLGLYKL